MWPYTVQDGCRAVLVLVRVVTGSFHRSFGSSLVPISVQSTLRTGEWALCAPTRSYDQNGEAMKVTRSRRGMRSLLCEDLGYQRP